MKAVILEIKNDFAAVLSDDGCIVTVKNNNYEIGQVIQRNHSRLQFTKKIGVFAATAAACVFLSVGAWAYASPYTYVSVDVNPSIEYTVNRFDRVLRVKAVNDDGEEILQEISLSNLKNKTIEQALATTVAQLSESGYFDGAIEGGIVITTASKDTEKADELAQELQQAVETEVAENGDMVVVEALSVSLARVEQAKELGVTPGKLNLVEKLQASAMDPTTINVEDWLNKSVKDIMKATKDNRKAAAVSGSAISVEINDQQKDQTKEQKLQDKEDQKLQDAEDKALEKAEKEEMKLKAEAEKATEKALAAEEKAKKAADKEKEADKKLKEAKKKNNQKELTAAEQAAKLAQKEADKAKKAKKSADKSAEEANQAAEEATQNVTKEAENTEGKDNHSKNTTNPSDKTTDQADKPTEQPSVQEDSTMEGVHQQEGNDSEKTDDAQDKSSNADTENPNGNNGNSNAGGRK
jgi:hypothetical protein